MLLHEADHLVDPDVGGGLLAPDVEDVEVVIRVNTNNDMHREVAALGRHREVRGAILGEMRWRRVVPAEPLFLE